MRIGVVFLVAIAGCAPALAFDTSKLPPTCRDTLAEMQSQKPRFGQLDALMARARKAGDTGGFCMAARETLAIIIHQSGKLDECLGEIAGDKTASEGAVGEMTQLKAYYRSMLAAAKKPENDLNKCGLANL